MHEIGLNYKSENENLRKTISVEFCSILRITLFLAKNTNLTPQRQ